MCTAPAAGTSKAATILLWRQPSVSLLLNLCVKTAAAIGGCVLEMDPAAARHKSVQLPTTAPSLIHPNANEIVCVCKLCCAVLIATAQTYVLCLG